MTTVATVVGYLVLGSWAAIACWVAYHLWERHRLARARSWLDGWHHTEALREDARRNYEAGYQRFMCDLLHVPTDPCIKAVLVPVNGVSELRWSVEENDPWIVARILASSPLFAPEREDHAA